MKMTERSFLALAAATALIGPVWAQSAERRATFTGGGGNDTGKCTIEVYVDGAADVEIRGDRGFLRTLSGQPAQWRRFVCSGPMPTNPGDLRFIGVDGRGKQELIQDPRSARGAAVVRIEDRDSGAEGYTFDLVWRGGDSGPGPAGRPFEGIDRRGDAPQGRDAARGAGRSGGDDDVTSACQRAAEQRIQRDGYRNVQFGWSNANNRRSDKIAGTARAQRGNDGRAYDFDVRCSVNPDNGGIRSLQVNRR